MKRRAQGEGSIYYNPKKCVWVAQLDLGVDNNGKRLRKTRTAGSKRDASRRLQEMRTANRATTTSSEVAPTTSTLASYLRSWLRHKAPDWAPRTRELYQHQAEYHVIPAIGDIRLNELKPTDIQNMVSNIARAGRKPTANRCRRMLSTALKQAVRWELITKNPVDAVDPVKERPTVPELWRKEDARRFLSYHHDHRHYAAFHLLIVSGLRRGELLGLRWSDVSEAGISVRQAVKLVANRPTIGPVKTQAARRYIALPDDTLAILAEHKRRQDQAKALVGEAWEHPELVFPSEVGSLMDPNNFGRSWNLAVKKAGVPRARIHDMRHLHISLLILAGDDAKTISERAGHTNASFTFDRYGHVFQEARQRSARSLTELLKESETTS